MFLRPLKDGAAPRDTLNGWRASTFSGSSIVRIRALRSRSHSSAVRYFLYTEQRHEPATPNALEGAPGSLPKDHTDMSRALLKQKQQELAGAELVTIPDEERTL